MIYAPNLDWTHELDMIIRLEHWVEDLGFPNLCILVFSETSRGLLSTLSDVGHVHNSYDEAQSFDKLKRALTSILVMCFLWNILLVANSFNFFEDCSSLFYKLL